MDGGLEWVGADWGCYNVFLGNGGIPLLDLVEALEERNGDEDNDSLLAVADFDLFLTDVRNPYAKTFGTNYKLQNQISLETIAKEQ